ncbi:hypothetical protein [uncultured Lutibacter sp.]|uniref:hypothetical protein n=1 Tax=uncultured Lutibacter sp. TaxID=437739 RepID=UPI00260733A6|nr:hypothetical protein [uncultured Lutibacter sp.]
MKNLLPKSHFSYSKPLPTIMKNYHIIELILNFLSSIFWPLVTIIIFLVLKNPLKNLINNIKKIGYGNTGIETTSGNFQKDEESILELLGDGNDESYIDNALGKFSAETVEAAIEIIENETKISEVDGLQNKYDRIYKYSRLLVLIKSFERVYDSIYGSQIKLLQRLNFTVDSKSSLKTFYENAKKIYPEAYNNYSYESYLNYLFNNGLILLQENDENVQITYFGKDFLRYLIEANLSIEKRF